MDHAALAQALDAGWIAGAALDVFTPEPLPRGLILPDQPKPMATPHMAFYSEESLVELEVKAAENVAAILSGRRPAALAASDGLSFQYYGQHLYCIWN